MQLAQTAGALLSAIDSPCYLVPVTSWKKDVVGKGNASKEEVAKWLEEFQNPRYLACEGDQNRIDATCIAMYGEAIVDSL